MLLYYVVELSYESLMLLIVYILNNFGEAAGFYYFYLSPLITCFMNNDRINSISKRPMKKAFEIINAKPKLSAFFIYKLF